MIDIRPYPPAWQLAPYVVGYFSGKMNAQTEAGISYTMIPNGCVELIVHLDEMYCQLPTSTGLSQTPDYMLIGLFSQPYQVYFQHTVPIFSIRFNPEAIPLLLGVPGKEVLDTYEDIELLLDQHFRDFCHRIRECRQTADRVGQADQFLTRLLACRKQTTAYVTAGTGMIRDGVDEPLEDISRRLYISQRQFERKFKEQIGITPKRYQRLMRIRKVMQTLEQYQSLDLTSVAYYCGYYDQAHFIKDFKQVTGKAPSVYRQDEQRFLYLPS